MTADMYNIDDKFFDNPIDYLIEELEWTEEDLLEMPDDYILTAKECDIEPVFQISEDWIIDRVNEERWSEDGREMDKVIASLKKNINFEAINSDMPKLWYPSRRKISWTKQELLDAWD